MNDHRNSSGSPAGDVDLAEIRQRALLEFFESSQDLVIVASLSDGTILDVNPAWEAVLGYRREELVGKSYLDLIHPEDRVRTAWIRDDIYARDSGSLTLENRYRTKNGGWRRLSWRVPEVSPDAEVILGIARDVTKVHEDAEDLHRMREELVTILATVPDTIVRASLDGRIEFINRAGRDVPPEVIVNTKMTDWLPSDAKEVLETALTEVRETSTPKTVELKVRGYHTQRDLHANRSTYRWYIVRIAPVSSDGRVESFILAAQDITDKKREELERDRSRRIMGLGRLAGGIAHDFNNTLTAILAVAELGLEREGLSTEERLRGFEDIRQAANRAAELTRQLLAFARPSLEAAPVLDLVSVVNELRPMLERMVGEQIELVCSHTGEPLPVAASRAQIEQLLVNLVTNARDAMDGQGRVDVALTREEEGMCLMEVSDEGQGMAQDTLEQVFEPFFTTKGNDGVGLGLSICYALVEKLGGHIDIESAPREGTVVRVRLPAAQTRPADPARSTDETPAPRSSGQREIVLLAEDEDLIRNSLSRALERQGYEVIAASDGEEALERAKHRLHEIALLVTDVIMPRCTGPELARELLDARPELPVLYISGHMGEEHGNRVPPDAAFLQKPFSVRLLTDRIRQLLSDDEASS